MTKEDVYEHMAMQFITPDPTIPCEFDDGRPCAELYEQASATRERIAVRTGLDFEDTDLLALIEKMEELGKVLALKMFDYGARFGGDQNVNCK